KERGEIDNPRENVLLFYTTHEDEVHFNTTRVVKHDATNAEDMTEAELIGRRQVRQMVRFLVGEVPGFENAWLSEMAPQIGIRESRRVMGDHVLDVDEVLGAAKFDDGIARGSYAVDIHNPAGTGTVIKRLPPGEAYDIPYRCLTPRGFDNMLIAARCVSCDHAAHSSLRVMPIVMAIGEAAGCAAEMALDGGDVRAVDVQALRGTLVGRGASIYGLEGPVA
ncbi:MAG: FAD-dependent oxidoreductase, partial [Armatimonadota bacterium]